MSTVDASVKITIDFVPQYRGDHWAVLIDQLGITVYGSSQEDALGCADQMMDFVVKTFNAHSTLDDFRRYLDAHDVQHSILVHDLNALTPQRYRREEVFAFA